MLEFFLVQTNRKSIRPFIFKKHHYNQTDTTVSLFQPILISALYVGFLWTVTRFVDLSKMMLYLDFQKVWTNIFGSYDHLNVFHIFWSESCTWIEDPMPCTSVDLVCMTSQALPCITLGISISLHTYRFLGELETIISWIY